MIRSKRKEIAIIIIKTTIPIIALVTTQLNNNAQNNNSIYWIENLLKIPIDDGRKTSICLILSPYLMNIKRLSYERSHSIIIDWLNKCSLLQRLTLILTHSLNPHYRML